MYVYPSPPEFIHHQLIDPSPITNFVIVTESELQRLDNTLVGQNKMY